MLAWMSFFFWCGIAYWISSETIPEAVKLRARLKRDIDSENYGQKNIDLYDLCMTRIGISTTIVAVAFLTFLTPFLDSIVSWNPHSNLIVAAIPAAAWYYKKLKLDAQWHEHHLSRSDTTHPDFQKPDQKTFAAEVEKGINWDLGILKPHILSAVGIEHAPPNQVFNLSNEASKVADCINALAYCLPTAELVRIDETGTPIEKWLEGVEPDGEKRFKPRENPSLLCIDLDYVRNIKISTGLPDRLRNEHMLIVAQSGHGKSQLIEDLVVTDLKAGRGSIVVDSQNSLINRMAERIPKEQLVLLDPEHCPPAIEIFAKPKDERASTQAVTFLEYIFSSLEQPLTGKQKTLFRFCIKLMFLVPNSNLDTLVELLVAKDLSKFQHYIDQLEPAEQSFFNDQFLGRNSSYTQTKGELLTRLNGIIINPTLNRMMKGEGFKVDIQKEIAQNKVILVSTANDFLQAENASIFGRVWITEIMKAVRGRTLEDPLVNFYIDEFHEYVSDSDTFASLFSQARKNNIGMTVATQEFSRIPESLCNVIIGNTSIKFAGSLTAKDANLMAANMNFDKEMFRDLKAGRFLTSLKGMPNIRSWGVTFGKYNTSPIKQPIEEVWRYMNLNATKPTKPRPVPPSKNDGDVPESGDWNP